MALILSLETSTDICSVALHENGKLLNEIIIHEAQAHAARLAPSIQEIFTLTDRSAGNLSAVSVSAGPGSYTGLRIGTSTAKGLCYALSIPLISVPTLEIMASAALPTVGQQGLACPMIDARRMEVYCQVFESDLRGVTEVNALVIDELSFKELLTDHKVFFFGNGSTKCRDVINSPNAIFVDNVFPQASHLGALASRKFDNNIFEDLTLFEPFYLKQFEAKKGQPLI